MVNGTTPRRINDSYDNVDTLIRNSNGNYWAATEANIQNAIDDVESSGGWIQIPKIKIIINSPPIYQPSNVDIYGAGQGKTILKLGDQANGSIIVNKHWTNGYSFPTEYDINLSIHDLTLDSNCFQQDTYTKTADYSQLAHTVKYMAVENVDIYRVTFLNSTADAIQIRHGSNCYIDYNEFYMIGMNFTFSDYDAEATTRCCYFFYCDNISFSNNYCQDLHCSAVGHEPGQGSGVVNNMQNFKFNDNIINNCWNGIWVEGHGKTDGLCVRNGEICNNVISNVTNPNGYILTNPGAMNGIGAVRYTYNITISGNTISHAGNKDDNTLGRGIWATGENFTISNNVLSDIMGYGIQSDGNNTISENIVNRCTNYGIYVHVSNSNLRLVVPQVIGNRIINTVGGISFQQGGGGVKQYIQNGICNNNIITGCDGANNEVNGIYNRFYNMTILGNTIDGGYYGIRQEGSYCDISHNSISDTTNIGIKVYYAPILSNCSFIGNHIQHCGNDGICLYDVKNCSFIGNHIQHCVDGIDEETSVYGCDGNLYLGNMCMSNSGNDYDINGAGCKPSVANRGEFNMGTFT